MSIPNRITLTHIRDVIKNAFMYNTKITPLGRWQITDKNINLVVDYSNEDHCGACTQYINNKYKENKYTNDYDYESLNINNPNLFKNIIYNEKLL